MNKEKRNPHKRNKFDHLMPQIFLCRKINKKENNPIQSNPLYTIIGHDFDNDHIQARVSVPAAR
jgi:hypothetical protein